MFILGDLRKDFADEKTHYVSAISLFIFTMISKECQWLLETELF
jgi:hypothetical protein